MNACVPLQRFIAQKAHEIQLARQPFVRLTAIDSGNHIAAAQ